MSRYLSPEWLAELDAAVRDVVVDPPPIVTVEQRITDADGAAVVYHLAADHGGARVVSGPVPGGADVVLTQDLATACAVALGELNALEALEAGRIQLGGDADRLRAASALFAAVAAAASSLRRTTEFPTG